MTFDVCLQAFGVMLFSSHSCAKLRDSDKVGHCLRKACLSSNSLCVWVFSVFCLVW